MKFRFRKVLKAMIIFSAALAVSIFVINIYIQHNGGEVCEGENFNAQAALVLGARVWSNGQMSDIFKDRVDVAIKLYRAHSVKKILVSGDNGRKDYDEVGSAKIYLLEQGIPEEDIFLDHAGFDTYDSMYRARDIFEAESLAVITQTFHLPRALYTAGALGISSCGVPADLHSYGGAARRNFREIFADVKAWLDVTVHSKPKFLGEKIPLSGDGRKSWY